MADSAVSGPNGGSYGWWVRCNHTGTSNSDTTSTVSWSTEWYRRWQTDAWTGSRLTSGSDNGLTYDTGNTTLPAGGNTWTMNTFHTSHAGSSSFARGATDRHVSVYGTVSTWAGSVNATVGGILIPKLEQAAVPGRPTLTSKTHTDASTDFVWQAPAVTGGRTYIFYVIDKDGHVDDGTTVAANTDFTVTLPSNGRYKFYYTAQGPNGVVQTGTQTDWYYTQPLAPTSVSATASGLQVTLAISRRDFYATRMDIQRSTSAAFTNVANVYSGVPINTYTETAPSGINYYRVRIYGPQPDFGNSAFSATAQATTMLAPAAVIGLTASFNGALDTVTLTWGESPTAVAPITYCEIERSFDNVTWTQVANIPGDQANVYREITQPNTIRYFRLRTVNAAGASAWANTAMQVSAITPVTSLAASPWLVDTSTGVFSTTLTWDAHPSTGTVTYTVFRSTDSVTYTQIATGTATTINDTLTPPRGTVSYYVVTNANINGNLRSSSSEVIEMSTEQEQELPVMSYDRNANTLTVSYPEQLFASDANPRTIAVSDQNGLVANITAGQAAGSQVVAYTPRSVIFVFTATSSYLYGDTIQLADVTVDVDRAPVTIDGRRYLASVIYDDGTEYPCMISIH